jgi:DNA primase
VEANHGDLKSRVLEATDIVDLIGRSVRLQKRGKEFVGLCPFHQEKTPSFHVSQAKQFFYCYGCKKHGNAIDFVIERDRLEFKDALTQLADAAGIAIADSGPAAHRAGEMQSLRDANAAAAMFFQQQLAHPSQGRSAREYLTNRGFTADSIKAFRIGLAIDGWDAFQSSPAARPFNPAILALAGLIKPRQQGGGYYDTFRNRLMFPIRDPEGRVIAFGGRVMPGNEDPAKYLNSAQTPLFDKGRCLFGLDLAKQTIVASRTAAVVEGYTDVVMAHQFGCTGVVSTLGTALTERHVSMLGRFADRIVLIFDPDAAGDAAVDRAVELFLTQDRLDIAVAQLSDGLDPDEFLLKNGAAAFNTAVEQAVDALTYKWRQLTRRFVQRADDLTGQQKAVEEYLALLAGARQAGPIDAIRWGAALQRASRLTQIPASELHRRFRTRPAARRMPQAQTHSLPKTVVPTARDLAEAQILGCLLCEPARWHDVQKHLMPTDFTTGPRRELAEVYWRHQRDEGEPVFNEFLGLLHEPPVKELAVKLAQECLNMPQPESWLRSGLEYLLAERQRLNEKALHARLNDGGQDEATLLQISESSWVPDPRRL